MLSQNLDVTLNKSIQFASHYSHQLATIEHLLYAMTYDQDAVTLLEACGVDIGRLKADLKDFLESDILPRAQDPEWEPTPTMGFHRVFERAAVHAQSSNREVVTAANLIVAMFKERDSHAVYFLLKQKMSRLDAIRFLSHGEAKVPHLSVERPIRGSEIGSQSQDDEGGAEPSPLHKFCTDLNAKARAGGVDPLIGRQWEIERIAQILCRRSKNNPVLLGEAGVGKTAIVEGLARLIVERKVPEPLWDYRIFALDIGGLLAGTRYRGDFEDRIKAVLKDIQKNPGSLLFIDEIHNIMGAGATSSGTIDASNLLKPALASGALKCIGSTTYKEFRNSFEKDMALMRRFQKIDVKEPSIEDAIRIVKGLKPCFEGHHHVRYTNEALVGAVELSARYLHERRLPDKALDVIDEVGAAERLKRKPRKTIGLADIEHQISQLARIPRKRVSEKERGVLQTLGQDLSRVVYGQAEAVEALVAAIKLSRAGLRDAEKPVGSYLFSGPTGVGKTEIARQLAFILGMELIRFDMSEYMEPHSVSRLIGAPPGYVGFDQGGLLTESVHRNPHAVLLLDEIEKAHMDLFNVLLQVMDYGKLTDHNGKKVDFRNVILIMTSNAGALRLSKQQIGFEREAVARMDDEAIQRTFSPEFRNRLDAVIPFNHLSPEVLDKIVDKFVTQIETQLQARHVQIHLTPAARTYLARKGYDRVMGARPLGRLVQKEIKQRLADELLFGELRRGGSVFVDCLHPNPPNPRQNELTFHIEALDPGPGKKRQKSLV